MRTVAALTPLLSTSAFAHQTPFDQAEFLKMTGGDPVAAQELSWFCSTSGKTLSECKDAFSGNGNLKQEAARKCLRDSIASMPKINVANGVNEVPGSRAHMVGGRRWHTEYKTDADGTHRHAYSERDREDAYNAKLTMELVAARNRLDAVYGRPPQLKPLALNRRSRKV